MKWAMPTPNCSPLFHLSSFEYRKTARLELSKIFGIKSGGIFIVFLFLAIYAKSNHSLFRERHFPIDVNLRDVLPRVSSSREQGDRRISRENGFFAQILRSFRIESTLKDDTFGVGRNVVFLKFTLMRRFTSRFS